MQTRINRITYLDKMESFLRVLVALKEAGRLEDAEEEEGPKEEEEPQEEEEEEEGRKQHKKSELVGAVRLALATRINLKPSKR